MQSHLFLPFILLSLFYVFATASGVSVGDVLLTPHYALISQQHCRLTVERDVSDGICPAALSTQPPIPHHSECYNATVEVALIHDIYGNESPMLFVAMKRPGLKPEFFLDNLKFPSDSTPLRYDYLTEETRLNKQVHLKTFTYWHQIRYVLYDSTTRLLYVLAEEIGSFPRAYVYMVDATFKPNSAVPYLMIFELHPNARSRKDWIVDPYEGKVRYSVKSGSSRDIYWLPVGRLYNALHGGERGELLMKLPEGINYQGVTGGLNLQLSSISILSHMHTSIHSYIEPFPPNETGSRQMSCQFDTDTATHRWPLAVVKDTDFCLLVGKDAKTCDEERQQWMKERGHLKESGFNWLIFWLAFLVVLELIVIVLLMAYVCWLRSSFDQDLPPEPAATPLRHYRDDDHFYRCEMDVSVNKFSVSRYG